MLTAVKGIYKNGQIILNEKPAIDQDTEVVVTFLVPEPLKKNGKEIRIGSMEGQFEVPDDFNEPLDDLKDYMY
jgi:hypothetical protein